MKCTICDGKGNYVKHDFIPNQILTCDIGICSNCDGEGFVNRPGGVH